MDLLTTIAQALGGDAPDRLSSAIGADPERTQRGLAAALPLLLGALDRNTDTAEGAAALDQALERDHDGSLLDHLAGFLGGGSAPSVPERATRGGGILDHLFGGGLGQAEDAVAKASGLDRQQTHRLLMLLAPVVLAALGRQKRQGGLDATGLASLLARAFGGARTAAPTDLAGVLTTVLGAGGRQRDTSGDALRQGADLLGRMLGGRR